MLIKGIKIAIGLLLAGLLLAVWPAAAQESADAAAQAVSGDYPILEAVAFYLFGGMAIAGSIGICVSRDVVRMAVCLFITLSSAALIYFLLGAYFVGVIQLIVYAGGTLILLIFGVMLTSKSPWVRFEVKRGEMLMAGLVCLLLAIGLIGTLVSTNWPEPQLRDKTTVEHLGRELLTTYLVPFEVASVLLLVVMIGAAYLARQEKD